MGSAWANIETLPGDCEINAIDELEEALGQIATKVEQVRQLITSPTLSHLTF